MSKLFRLLLLKYLESESFGVLNESKRDFGGSESMKFINADNPDGNFR